MVKKMPNYDLMCLNCKNEFEEFAKISDKDEIKCNMCNGDTVSLITQKGFQFYEGFDPDLNAYITGPDQRRRVMKAKSIEEVPKYESNRIDKIIPKRKKDTVFDAHLRAREKGAFSLGEIG